MRLSVSAMWREGRNDRTHFLCRVVLHLQLDAGALACDKHTADNTRLRPDLAALSNNETLRRRPTVLLLLLLVVVVAGVSLEYVYGTLACHEPILVFPCDASTCADFVTYPCEPISKVY